MCKSPNAGCQIDQTDKLIKGMHNKASLFIVSFTNFYRFLLSYPDTNMLNPSKFFVVFDNPHKSVQIDPNIP